MKLQMFFVIGMLLIATLLIANMPPSLGGTTRVEALLVMVILMLGMIATWLVVRL